MLLNTSIFCKSSIKLTQIWQLTVIHPANWYYIKLSEIKQFSRENLFHVSSIWMQIRLSKKNYIKNKKTKNSRHGGMILIPALGRLRQEDHFKSETSLGYTAGLCPPKSKQQQQKNEQKQILVLFFPESDHKTWQAYPKVGQ